MRGDDSNFSGVGAIPSLFFTEEFANKMIEQYNRKCWQIGSKRCKTHIQKIKITEIVS